jgi:hypothetical protein
MKEGWVNPRVSLDVTEKRKIFPLLGSQTPATPNDLLRKIMKNFSQDSQYPSQDMNCTVRFELGSEIQEALQHKTTRLVE